MRNRQRETEHELNATRNLIGVLIDRGVITAQDVDGLIDYAPRQKAFIDRLVQAKVSGVEDREAKLVAMREAYPRSRIRTNETVLKMADENLERPEVCVYAEAKFKQAGLSTDGMFAKLVEHVRGIEYETVGTDKDGNEVTTKRKDPPNYQALKDSIGLVVPKQPSKIQQEIAIGVGVMQGPPGFTARQLPAPKRKLKKGEDDV